MTVDLTNKTNELELDSTTISSDLMRRLAQCLHDYVEQHCDKKKEYIAISALASLTMYHVDKHGAVTPPASFSTENVTNYAKFRINQSPSKTLSPIWANVEALKSTRINGIQDFARKEGLEYYPWVDRIVSRGGTPSQYFMVWFPLPERETGKDDPLDEGEIAYIQELTLEPSWWAKPILKNGYRLEGWRKKTFVGYWLALILGALIVANIISWPLILNISVSPKGIVQNILICGIILAFLGKKIWSIYQLFTWRIGMASSNLVAWGELHKENVQIEVIRDDDGLAVIRLVRYAATCGCCKAKLELARGGKEFPNRLVGRCYENPAEHVYSFDRHTLRGRLLR